MTIMASFWSVSLMEYLEKNYSNLYFVSSTTKVLTDFRQLLDEVNREDFRYVVPDFRLNKVFNKLNIIAFAFTSGLKEMIEAGKNLKKSGGVDKYVELNELKADLSGKLQSQNAYVESLEHEYNELTKIKGADESVVAALKLKLATNKSIRDSLKSQLNLTDEQIAKLGTDWSTVREYNYKKSVAVLPVRTAVTAVFSLLGIVCELIFFFVNDHAGQTFFALLYVLLKLTALLSALVLRAEKQRVEFF